MYGRTVTSMLTVVRVWGIVAGLASVVALGGHRESMERVRGSTEIFVLTSGEAIEGRVAKKNRVGLEVDTAFGRRTLRPEEVVTKRTSKTDRDEYRRRLSNLDRKDTAAHERLARWCASRGLTSGLVERLDHLLRRDPANAFARGQVRRASSRYEITAKNPHPVAKKNRRQRAQVDLLYRAVRKDDFVRAAVVSAQLATLPAEIQLNQAIRHAERGRGLQRLVGVEALARAKEVRRVKTLYVASLTDPTWQVRRMAVASLKVRDDGTTYRPYVKAMLRRSSSDVLRVNAATALGYLGDKRGIAPIVRAMRAAGEDGRSHSNYQRINQVAYVKDYDVEVAQTAFIADPVVDVILDGIVLDVAVVQVSRQRRIMGHALRRLSGKNFGGNVKAWTSWLQAGGRKADGKS